MAGGRGPWPVTIGSRELSRMNWDGDEERNAPSVELVILLRVEDAAMRLSIARTLMFRLIKEGEVESVRVGRLRRVPVASLEEYVARLRARQDAKSPAA